MHEQFIERPGKSPHNPEGIPERTLKEVDVPEFGPVTFPAYAGATAGLRTVSVDSFLARRRSRPVSVDNFLARSG
jgi:hypothetical protein